MKIQNFLPWFLERTTENAAVGSDYSDDKDYYENEEESYEDEIPETKDDSGFLSGLRDKLGIAPKNTVFRLVSFIRF